MAILLLKDLSLRGRLLLALLVAVIVAAFALCSGLDKADYRAGRNRIQTPPVEVPR